MIEFRVCSAEGIVDLASFSATAPRRYAGCSCPEISQPGQSSGNVGGTRTEAAMACSSAKDGQKARIFQYHGARKKGPGGTEESAPEIGSG
jgi:hypothetical protein